jgi:putative PIN family toxin of toxin-antitoxin system
MLRIVLDTNVLLASISQKSRFHWVWQSFLDGKYKLCVTTDILEEYEEVIERYFSILDADHTLTEMMLHENLVQIVRYFEWTAIKNDPDDNKFFDCAVAANADYIVSQDKHLNVLKDIPFPSVSCVNVFLFKEILEN